MSDLVERLRDFSPEFYETCPEIRQAADELERLTAELAAANDRGESLYKAGVKYCSLTDRYRSALEEIAAQERTIAAGIAKRALNN